MSQFEIQTSETKSDIVVSDGGIFFNVAMFEHAQRVAKMLASSDMIPDHFRDKVGNCVIALNLAARMKCDPFMLMQNLYIVHGKPGIEAKLAIALVNASGKFTPIQYDFDDDKQKCVAYASRTDNGEMCRSVPVTIQMAKDEGWLSKPGSKWKTMPELMLQYRSAMFFARAFCPEVLLGMQSRDELFDAIDMRSVGGNKFEQIPEKEFTPEDFDNEFADEIQETEWADFWKGAVDFHANHEDEKVRMDEDQLKVDIMSGDVAAIRVAFNKYTVGPKKIPKTEQKSTKKTTPKKQKSKTAAAVKKSKLEAQAKMIQSDAWAGCQAYKDEFPEIYEREVQISGEPESEQDCIDLLDRCQVASNAVDAGDGIPG